jgi:hypothetical protein
MKISNTLLLLLMTGIISLSSCGDAFWNCIDGNGSTATARRAVGDFTNVESSGDFVVDVTIGPATRVSVEADENLLSYIETYIQGNTLIIETQDNRCIKSSGQVKVHVETPSLYELKMLGSGVIYCDSLFTDEVRFVLSGSGDIECTGILADFIDATIEGSGEITLSGSCANTNFSIEGSGNIKSMSLEQNNCVATITGSGNIYAFVNQHLDAVIDGSGNVVYKGDPAIIKEIRGSGRVIRY